VIVLSLKSPFALGQSFPEAQAESFCHENLVRAANHDGPAHLEHSSYLPLFATEEIIYGGINNAMSKII
jgi:hypothetical protein